MRRRKTFQLGMPPTCSLLLQRTHISRVQVTATTLHDNHKNDAGVPVTKSPKRWTSKSGPYPRHKPCGNDTCSNISVFRVVLCPNQQNPQKHIRNSCTSPHQRRGMKGLVVLIGVVSKKSTGGLTLREDSDDAGWGNWGASDAEDCAHPLIVQPHA